MTEKSASRESITVITGAGASVSAGSPTTKQLTELISQSDLSHNILDRLLRTDRPAEATNFEDVLHVLEELEAYLNPEEASRAVSDLKPFLALSRDTADISDDWREHRKERLSLLQHIQARLIEVDDGGKGHLYAWLRPLADSYDLRWFTLNYDTVADRTINAISVDVGSKWYNGFDPTTRHFRSDEYSQAEEKVGELRLWLAHLHGCVRFGYDQTQAGLAHGPPLEIIEMASADEATRNWQQFHQAFLMDEYADLANVVSPIVSGLRKLERLNSQPYSSYLNSLFDSLARSPNLLLIGYGGADPHINHQLTQFFFTNLSRTRVVEVTRAADPKDSAVGKLTHFPFKQTWEKIGDGIFVSRWGVPATVILTGIGESSPPTQIILDSLHDKYAGPLRFSS